VVQTRKVGRATLVLAVVAGTLTMDATMSIAQNPASGQSPECPPGELISRRTRNSKTVVHEDCSYTTTFGHNLHYEVEPGRWEEVDLQFRRDGEDYVADRNATVVRVAGARLQITDRETGGGITWVLPGPPAIAEHRARFSWRGLDWDYAVTDVGVKLQADVASARGPQTYEFSYHLLGGRQPLVVGDRGDLEGDGFYIPRAFALGADGKTYDAGDWRLLPGQRVAFEFDDSGLPPGAFPYVLDPTTYFKTAAVGDEGDVNKSGFPYPPPSCGGWSDSGSTIVPSRSSNAKPDEFYTTNGFMSWDTSSLPDNATIASTTLKFYTRSKSNMNSRSLTADWYSAWPIDCSDFSDSAQTSAIGGIPLTDIPTPDASTIVTLSGSATGVSRTGRTGLRTHISGDQPLGYNSVEIYQVGNPYNMGNPDLNVTYSVPGGAPTILSATDSPDPVTAGATTTFSVGWSDPDVGDQVRAVICKTSLVTSSGQCADETWAAGGYFSSSPSSVPFVTSPSIAGTNTYYAFACDEAGACSSGLSGTFTVSSANTTPTITSVTDSPDPVPAGIAVNFNLGWTDPNSGDSVRAVICKSNSISSGSCPAGGWVTGNLSSTSPASASLTTNSANEGPNPYYAYVCDQANACSSSSLFGTFTVSPPNGAPGITSAGDSPDPVTAGNPMNFTVGWTDPNAGDTVKAVICKTNAIASGSCSGGTWASGTLSSTSPAGASFTTTSANVGTNTYYAFACDQWNACSGSLSGTFTVASNAAPTIISAIDSPDPVTAGNAISFSVGWSDSNSGDRVKAVICKTSVIAAGSCSGDTWASGSLSSTSPASASYTTTSAEIGTNTYYAFVCDQANACSSALSGTFQVIAPNGAPAATWVSDSPDPVTAGNAITFSVGWSDPNQGDTVRALVCKTNAVNAGGSCSGGAWAASAAGAMSPAATSYATTAGDIGTNSYFAFVCDQANACSSSLGGTFSVTAANSAPDIAGVSDAPDPVAPGRQITFSVNWGDSNGDAVKALICRTNQVFGASCSGGAWASGTFVTTSPIQLTYTPSSMDMGTRSYYAFVCDSAGACSSSIGGTFTVQNERPSILGAFDAPTRVVAGDVVTFSVDWADAGDRVQAVVCKSDFVLSGMCPGGAWGIGALSFTSPATVSYRTSSVDRTAQAYWAFACDDAGACSPAESGTFGVYQGHVPPWAIEDGGGDTGTHPIDDGSSSEATAVALGLSTSTSTPFLDTHCAADQNDTATPNVFVPVLAYDSLKGVQIQEAQKRVRQEMRGADRAVAEAHETFKQHMRLQCDTASTDGWSRIHVRNQRVPRTNPPSSEDADLDDDGFLDCDETISWLQGTSPYFMSDPDRRYIFFLDSGLAGRDCSAGDSLALMNTTPGLGNPNNTEAGWASLDYSNWRPDGISSESIPVLLQEVFHSLGLTSTDSPGYCCDVHTRDYPDFMGKHYCHPGRTPQCLNERNPELQSIRITCTVPARVTIPDSYTDCGRDTYWDPTPEPEEWLCDHYNIATDSLYFHQRALRETECID
jgi:hypothetical protein